MLTSNGPEGLDSPVCMCMCITLCAPRRGARLFGGLLFDALMIKFNDFAIASKPVSHTSPANDEASAPSSGNFNYSFANFGQNSL